VGCDGLLLENVGARIMRTPDSRLDAKFLETCKKHFIGRLLPEVRKLFLRGRRQRSVSHIGKKGEEIATKKSLKRTRTSKGKKGKSKKDKRGNVNFREAEESNDR
jgi:hypothetical protein